MPPLLKVLQPNYADTLRFTRKEGLKNAGQVFRGAVKKEAYDEAKWVGVGAAAEAGLHTAGLGTHGASILGAAALAAGTKLYKMRKLAKQPFYKRALATLKTDYPLRSALVGGGALGGGVGTYYGVRREKRHEPRIILHPSRSHWTRSQMPQIDNAKGFLANLEKRGVHHKLITISSGHLRATQNEVNLGLVDRILAAGLDTKKYPLVISNDKHVIDGHNRLIAAQILHKPVKAIRIDLHQRAALNAALRYNPRRAAIGSVKP